MSSTKIQKMYNKSMLGKKIKQLRHEKNISQYKLARDLNVIQSAVGQWETDKTDPSIENIIAIAKYFEVTTDYLLGLEDEIGRRIYNYGNNVENNYGTVNQYSKEKKRS